ncbi:MAG: MBL fold metallo-hydrolase, partial [Candidatus Jordarchaeaceae archaeon]
MIETSRFEEVTQIKMSLELDARPVYWTSAYLVDGLLIDTGPRHTVEELVNYLKDQKIRLVVNTHWHEDHIGANKILQQMGVQIFAHRDSIPLISKPLNLPPYREWVWGVPDPTEVLPVPEKICTDSYQFEVVETPGHSEGHIALVEPSKGWCFSGDLFYGEKPKVTHPKANISETINSMRKLAALRTRRLVLFTSTGIIVEDGRKALQTCINYLEELTQKAKKLKKKGLSINAIREKLLGEESSLARITMGELSSINLIRLAVCNSFKISGLKIVKNPKNRETNQKNKGDHKGEKPMMKTYTLPHNHQLHQFFRAYLTLLNLMITDIWNHIQWREKPLRGRKQRRLLPTIPSYAFKKEMREKHLKEWIYARHWVDSA